jgi:hypothetical protein
MNYGTRVRIIMPNPIGTPYPMHKRIGTIATCTKIEGFYSDPEQNLTIAFPILGSGKSFSYKVKWLEELSEEEFQNEYQTQILLES